MKVEFQISRRDLIVANLSALLLLRLPLAVLLMMVVLVSAALDLTDGTYPASQGDWVAFFFTHLFAFLAGGFAGVISGAAIAVLMAFKDKKLLGRYRCEITPESLEYANETSKSCYRWTAVLDIRKSSSAIFFRVAYALFLRVPMKAFENPEQLVGFERQAKEFWQRAKSS